MKKLLSISAAFSIVLTASIPVVSCTYINTINKSIDNKIKQLTNSTSHFFKGAILANSESYNGQDVDQLLNTLNTSDVSNDYKDDSKLSKVFKSYLDENQSKKFLTYNVYTRDEFNNAKETNPIKENLGAFIKLFNEVKKIIGVKLDPYTISPLITLLMDKTLSYDNFSIINTIQKANILEKIKNFNKVNTPSYQDLVIKGIKTNRDLKYYTLGQVSVLINYLVTGEEIDDSQFTTKDFFANNKKVFSNLINKDEVENSETKTPQIDVILKRVFNIVMGLNWYIKNFTTEEFDMKAEYMKEDNHVFSEKKTNLEVFADVNSREIDRNIIESIDLSGFLLLIKDLFSGEEDKEHYKLNRMLKILFQVDDLTQESKESLNFDNKVVKIKNISIVGLELGEWQTNSSKDNGIFNPFLSSTLSGLADGFIINYDQDGGIRELLKLMGLEIDSIGNVISGLINSTLSGIDMSGFFYTMIDQLKQSVKNLLSWSIWDLTGLKDELNDLIINLKNKLKPLNDILTKINDLGLSNKLLGVISSTPIRKIMEVLKMDDKFPFELPNWSLKDILNYKLISDYNLADLLNVATDVVGVLINVVGKGLVPKLTRILESLLDTSWFESDDIKVYDNYGSIMDKKQIIGQDNFDKLSWKKDNKDVISNIVFAKPFASTNNAGLTIQVPVGFANNESLLHLKGTNITKYILGLGVQEGQSMNYNKFREYSFLYELSTLWNGETGIIINKTFELIQKTLEYISSQFEESKKNDYLANLHYSNFQTNIISYKNFKDPEQESEIVYNVTYAFGEISNTYQVKLLLPVSDGNKDVKYLIDSFEKI